MEGIPKQIREKVYDFYRTFPTFNLVEALEVDQDEVAGGLVSWYKCPFGCQNRAYIRRDTTLVIPIIYCPFCDQHGWVDRRKMVVTVLDQEETRFREIIKRYWDKNPNSMSPEQACIEWHSRGCPLELAEELAWDVSKFRRLVEQHIERSRGNHQVVWG